MPNNLNDFMTLTLLERMGSGVATPGHTRACAHVKFTGAQVKVMWKAKVKDQLLACVFAFMWMHMKQAYR